MLELATLAVHPMHVFGLWEDIEAPGENPAGIRPALNIYLNTYFKYMLMTWQMELSTVELH